MGHPYHHRLGQPLGEREVIDAVAGLPVEYFNVYDGIERRVGGSAARELGTSARCAIMPSVSDGVMNRAERSLLDAVAAGELDEHLDALAAAVSARQATRVRSATRLMSLCEGDSVRINGRMSPRYLAGLRATVLDIDHAAGDSAARAAGRALRGRQGSRAGLSTEMGAPA